MDKKKKNRSGQEYKKYNNTSLAETTH